MNANPPRTLQDFSRGLRRWWYVVVLAALAGFVLAQLVASGGSRSRSEATVRISDKRDIATSLGLGEAYVDNLLPSAIAADARTRLDALAPTSPGADFGVVADDAAFTIDVIARAPTVSGAEAAAAELARGIVAQVQRDVDARGATMAARHIDRLEQIDAELQAAPDDLERTLLLVERNGHLDALAAVAALGATPAATFDREADQSSGAASSRVVYGGAGLVVGAALGLLIVYLRVAADRRVRRGADLELTTGLPTLAVLTPRSVSGDAAAVIALASALHRRFGPGRSVALVGIGSTGSAAVPAVAAATTDAMAGLVPEPAERTSVVALPMADGAELPLSAALDADATVLVTPIDRSTIDDVRTTIATLETAGVTVFGHVVTGVRDGDLTWASTPAGTAPPAG